MTWTGEWDADHGDRVYGTDAVAIGNAAALLTGIQHRNGTTVSGIALRVRGSIIPGPPHAAVVTDLTPAQARELADLLVELAHRAEKLDGLRSG
ncbi:MAG: hypothetical protein KDB72_03025 [Mycobacterium sp.]|nr:hypothetical protein [Mycobacterium sp.]